MSLPEKNKARNVRKARLTMMPIKEGGTIKTRTKVKNPKLIYSHLCQFHGQRLQNVAMPICISYPSYPQISHSKQTPPKQLVILHEAVRETEIPLFDLGDHLISSSWSVATPRRPTGTLAAGLVAPPARPAKSSSTELEGVSSSTELEGETVAKPTTGKLIEAAEVPEDAATKAEKGRAAVDTAKGALDTNFSHTDFVFPGLEVKLQG